MTRGPRAPHDLAAPGGGRDASPAVEPLPHAGLYTRLRPAPGKGIGVFAIRDIPPDMNPFPGDGGPTRLVPSEVVDGIANAEMRRLYLDFCPLVDGHYLAPADFNRMTIAWYLNHSDQPNVLTDRDVEFRTARLIRTGEELTVDYRTFSSHAGLYIAGWTRADEP